MDQDWKGVELWSLFQEPQSAGIGLGQITAHHERGVDDVDVALSISRPIATVAGNGKIRATSQKPSRQCTRTYAGRKKQVQKVVLPGSLQQGSPLTAGSGRATPERLSKPGAEPRRSLEQRTHTCTNTPAIFLVLKPSACHQCRASPVR